MKYADKIIKNLSDLLSRLSTDIKPDYGPIWYRGDSDKDSELVPSIYRTNRTKKEIDYLKEFKQDATLLVEPRSYSSYEWLFIMRHHGIPTRLLDWTESPLVATFFAVEEGNENKDGVIWVLLPIELNKNIKEFESADTLPSFEEDQSLLHSWSPDLFATTDPENSMLPIAFLAPRNSRRMQAQLSVFTISHHDKTPIDKIGNQNHIWRYIIPKEAKNTIKKELELLRITRFQLFPELESIRYKMREKDDVTN